MSELRLLPCPFCGGPADFEECPQGSSVSPTSCTWSVGCANQDEDCIGYQMLAHFNRKGEAAAAWNKRAENAELAEYERNLASARKQLAEREPECWDDLVDELASVRKQLVKARDALMEISEMEEVFLDTAPQVAKAALTNEEGKANV